MFIQYIQYIDYSLFICASLSLSLSKVNMVHKPSGLCVHSVPFENPQACRGSLLFFHCLSHICSLCVTNHRLRPSPHDNLLEFQHQKPLDTPSTSLGGPWLFCPLAIAIPL